MLLGDTTRPDGFLGMGTFGSPDVTRTLGPVIRCGGRRGAGRFSCRNGSRASASAGRRVSQVNAGVVSDASAPGKRVSYAELVQGKRIERHIEKTPLKPVAAFRGDRAIAPAQGMRSRR